MASVNFPLAELDDAALLSLSLLEAEAFGVFYDRHVLGVLGFFMRRTSCPHTSADLTAETFAQALRSASKYKAGKGDPGAWLFGIARNELSHFLRRKEVSERSMKRIGVSAIELDDISIERIDSLLDNSACMDSLATELSKLPSSVSDALKLRIGHELSFEEVARQLGCTPGAARVRVSRGLSRLAEVVNV
jgi:RNA polymerase sigma factor (sigma-70 family)